MSRNLIIFIIIVIAASIIITAIIFHNRNNKKTPSHNNPIKIYKSPYKKIRVGRDNDGGYVIASDNKLKYDILISCGISDDTSFEDHFLQLNPSIKKCLAFDGTIESLPENNKNEKIKFIRKNIGAVNNEKTDNLSHYLERYKNIFLKMDIEGGEYEWIKSADKDSMENISQIVIEIHNRNNKNGWDILNKLSETHYLIHIHGNNCCGITDMNGIKIPEVIECTYIKRKDMGNNLKEYSSFTMPTELDDPNLKGLKDIHLSI